jgi:hypothetical protein
MLENLTLPKELAGLQIHPAYKCPEPDCVKYECSRKYCSGCSHYWCDHIFPKHPCAFFARENNPTVFDVWGMVQAAWLKLGSTAEDPEITKEVERLIEAFRKDREAR